MAKREIDKIPDDSWLLRSTCHICKKNLVWRFAKPETMDKTGSIFGAVCCGHLYIPTKENLRSEWKPF